MEKIKQLLKITSEFRSHSNNLAKGYALLDNGEFLTLGQDSLLFQHELYKIRKTDDSKFAMVRITDKYTLCYGISLPNIINMLSNKHVLIIGINTYKGYMDVRKYVITLQREFSSVPEAYNFEETTFLSSFEKTDLAHFLFQLYDIKEEISNL